MSQTPTTKTPRDLKLGGPGHDGYVYKADTYCVACGHAVIDRLWAAGEIQKTPQWLEGDTDHVPQPIFFGEHDRRVHCAECHEFMYGADPEPEVEDDVRADDPS